jgi:transcription termination/antitermination protein NusA
VLETFSLSPDDAEALIMRARIAMGWVEPEPEPEPELQETEFDGGEIAADEEA